MTKEELGKLKLNELKELAKSEDVKISGLKKEDIIAMFMEKYAEEQKKEKKPVKKKTTKKAKEEKEEEAVSEAEETEEVLGESEVIPQVEEDQSESDTTVENKEVRIIGKKSEPDLKADGILTVMEDGYGFIRGENFETGDDNVFVSPTFIKKFRLRTGDHITGKRRLPKDNERYGALIYIDKINLLDTDMIRSRVAFEDLTPIFPNERVILERPGESLSMRVMDLITPIGKGQRGLIVSPPKAGKTTILKDIALSILRSCPKAHLIILLIDERPEEVTDIKEIVKGDNVMIVYSTFDEQPTKHKFVSEMTIEHAKRLVEAGEDVFILLDSITRLSRAYNLTEASSGKTLSGGLDPNALYMPKRFFGAARNTRERGSLTILATALVDTGSKMDDVIYEEFKGTGNMELILSRKLQERRLFPAIDIAKSGTRREDLLLTAEEQSAVNIIRRDIMNYYRDDSIDGLIELFVRTKDNASLVQVINRNKGF
ncbi:MAG: transcription termination factor Rho [Erysipelotrichaceae bacterium]|nr:transcription termination factor Rho [Erysipelotrichaceae bacterium]